MLDRMDLGAPEADERAATRLRCRRSAPVCQSRQWPAVVTGEATVRPSEAQAEPSSPSRLT